jgi:hypothetical protein
MMNCASSGCAIGPPWQRMIASRRTESAAAAIASIESRLSSSVLPEVATIEAPSVYPICATMMSAPAFAIAFASSGLKT